MPSSRKSSGGLYERSNRTIEDSLHRSGTGSTASQADTGHSSRVRRHAPRLRSATTSHGAIRDDRSGLRDPGPAHRHTAPEARSSANTYRAQIGRARRQHASRHLIRTASRSLTWRDSKTLSLLLFSPPPKFASPGASSPAETQSFLRYNLSSAAHLLDMEGHKYHMDLGGL